MADLTDDQIIEQAIGLDTPTDEAVFAPELPAVEPAPVVVEPEPVVPMGQPELPQVIAEEPAEPSFNLGGVKVTSQNIDTMVAKGLISQDMGEKLKLQQNGDIPGRQEAIMEPEEEPEEVMKSPVRPEGIEPAQVQNIAPELGQFGQALTQEAQGYQDLEDAIKRSAVVGASKAAEESSYIREAAAQQEQIQIEQQEKEDLRMQRLEEAMNTYDELRQEVGAEKIDSGRLWANMGTGRKILAGIGLALSAIGGPQSANNAMNIINGAIDRDINEQKANLESKRKGLAAQDNMISRMRQRFGDERVADKAAKLAALERTELKLKELSARFNAPQQIAKANEAIATLQVQKDKAANDFNVEVAKLAEKRAAVGSRLTPGSIVDAAQLGQMDKDTRGSFVPMGDNRFAVTAVKPSPAQRDGIVALDSSVRGIEKLAAYADKDWAKLSPTQRGEIESLRNALMGSLRLPILGPGVMTETEVERLKKTIPDPKAFLTWAGKEKAKAKVLIDHFADQKARQLNALGVPMDVAAGNVKSFKPE